MELILKTILETEHYTLGTLFINGKLFSFTLEDPFHLTKIAGDTRIPRGVYEIRKTMSPRFGRVMPEIMSVPNYTGIRMHVGNSEADTEGCLLIGYRCDLVNAPHLQASTNAASTLESTLMSALDANEKVMIHILEV